MSDDVQVDFGRAGIPLICEMLTSELGVLLRRFKIVTTLFSFLALRINNDDPVESEIFSYQ